MGVDKGERVWYTCGMMRIWDWEIDGLCGVSRDCDRRGHISGAIGA